MGNKWIDVNVELPCFNKPLIVFNGKVSIAVMWSKHKWMGMIEEYDTDPRNYKGPYKSIEHATHWMELPEYPNKEG